MYADYQDYGRIRLRKIVQRVKKVNPVTTVRLAVQGRIKEAGKRLLTSTNPVALATQLVSDDKRKLDWARVTMPTSVLAIENKKLRKNAAIGYAVAGAIAGGIALAGGVALTGAGATAAGTGATAAGTTAAGGGMTSTAAGLLAKAQQAKAAVSQVRKAVKGVTKSAAPETAQVEAVTRMPQEKQMYQAGMFGGSPLIIGGALVASTIIYLLFRRNDNV